MSILLAPETVMPGLAQKTSIFCMSCRTLWPTKNEVLPNRLSFYGDSHFEGIVTGLAIFEPLDGLTDGFGCSDGLRWVQDRLDEPVVPFPTTV
jgi:hypothetical protein